MDHPVNFLGNAVVADLHEAAAGPADGVHRVDPAQRPRGIRGGKLQGALRVYRARAEREGEPLNDEMKLRCVLKMI